MIKLDKVSKYYSNGTNVSLGLHNVSLELNKGELVAIVGESGSGKSTFLNVVTGLDTFEEGEIFYNDLAVSSMTNSEMGEFRKNNIGFIFQNYNLIDSYTVLQNVMMPLILKGMSTKEAKVKAKELLEKVGLAKRMRHKGTKLSGGEKQRCVIARALASDSEILACDEPTGNLDSKTGKEIIQLIKEVAKDKLVLIVTHNYEELEDIVTRRLKFADGALIEDTILVENTTTQDQSFKENDKNLKITKNEKLKLSIKDVFTTPKKTILTTIIFLALAFFTAFMFVSVVTYSDPFDYTWPMINNCTEDRIVILDNNINKADLEGYNYYVNSQYENENLLNLKKQNGDYFAPLLRMNIDGVTIEKGRMPEADNEVVIGVSKNAYATYYNEEFTYNDFGEEKKLKVVGYYRYNDSNSFFNATLITGSKNTNERIKANLIYEQNLFKFAFQKDRYSSIAYSINETIKKNTIKITCSDIYKTSDLKVQDVLLEKIYSYYNYKVDADFDITYSDSYSSESFDIELSSETLVSLYEEHIVDCSLYESDKDKRNDLISSLRKKGYNAASAADVKYKDDLGIDNIINTIYYVFFMVGVIGGLFTVFFISYIVLSKIFAIKNKDYTILRTLGMSERDMSHLVIIQTIFIGIVSTIVILLAAYISLLFKYPIIKKIGEINAFEIILYLVFMVFYTYLFARRFNRRLFKFSVQKTLRGGVIGND